MSISRALNTKQAAEYIGMSEDYMKHARVTGKGPIFRKIGRKVIYLREELDSFLSSLPVRLNTVAFGPLEEE